MKTSIKRDLLTVGMICVALISLAVAPRRFAKSGLLEAQDQDNAHFLATADTTALTVQQPATNGLQVTFDKAWVYCASAQVATLSWNGTAATATTLTTKRIPPQRFPSNATAWSGSNVGAGTTGPTYQVPAGGTFTIDLSKFKMGNTGTGTNVSIATDGTCTISISWSEK